jgi:hypothetical protein
MVRVQIQGFTVDYGEPPVIRARIVFAGQDLNLDEISSRLVLQPTATHLKGEPRPRPVPPLPESIWVFEVEKASFALDEVLSALLEQLWERRAIIRELAARPGTRVEFVVTITLYENDPQYCFYPETIRRLGYFGFEVCLDFYGYPVAARTPPV